MATERMDPDVRTRTLEDIVSKVANLNDPYDADTGLCLLCDVGSDTKPHAADCPYQRAREATARDTMPVTADCILRAGAMLLPILPPQFYGETTIKWEAGKPVRMEKKESLKI